ncbi:chloride channel protein [Petropleomorpha daqingensis]|uniref:H+/Cl- antiporter ClcA n=1 Tax=Petropleomorpha daqingensis TaxID=2026353 RepID=A0A853CMF6_9ACTN|nr:chloride channel protein [Petropleomorpha daqingensis]NYJ08616.1 H+/Cl- antiporter ClcA [Petropleomorpha daqingensis]
MTTQASDSSAPAAAADPAALLRSRQYLQLLVLSVVLGVPISAIAYGFLALSDTLQDWLYSDLPAALDLDPVPAWWPLPVLGAGGLLVAVLIRYVPGHGGESPLGGFTPGGGAPGPVPLLGIAVAALVSLAAGAVVGPEAPLVAIGGGLAALAVRAARRGAPAQVLTVVAAAGSFAAISALLGSPLSGAFLLMEAVGLGGPLLRTLLLPGLVASGIGTLVFIGLDAWTGLGTFTLALPDLPSFAHPDLAQLAWAVPIGVAAALLVSGIRRVAVPLRAPVERRILVAGPLVGLAVAGLAIGYAQLTGHGTADVLFSGEAGLPAVVSRSAEYSTGALLLLLVCKSLAYAGSLVAFRGGPTFPAIFLGAVGGIALSAIPGLPLVPAIAMGMGATCAAMLQLPLTSVLLATLIMGADGLAVMPVVIVAVAVSYVVTARLTPPVPAAAPAAAPAAK